MSKGTTSLTQAAKALGSKGGRKGGPARALKLSDAQKHAIAKKGGEARARKAAKG